MVVEVCCSDIPCIPSFPGFPLFSPTGIPLQGPIPFTRPGILLSPAALQPPFISTQEVLFLAGEQIPAAASFENGREQIEKQTMEEARQHYTLPSPESRQGCDWDTSTQPLLWKLD